MGMSVFTGLFEDYDITFAALALAFCLLARFLNIFPLSFIANLCRNESNRISVKMQTVLWFAGLRGAVAFALAMNMPGYVSYHTKLCVFVALESDIFAWCAALLGENAVGVWSLSHE
jgi:NhaP-type Na+/H+ or K+/H+ antiporter